MSSQYGASADAYHLTAPAPEGEAATVPAEPVPTGNGETQAQAGEVSAATEAAGESAEPQAADKEAQPVASEQGASV